jgi:protocatechuate 3,4-dioxygenase beta subunit
MLTAAAGFAQNTNSGDLRGTVTDPTGAVLPGATVTVQDVDKGVTHTYTTDGAGLYDTGSIVPDHYHGDLHDTVDSRRTCAAPSRWRWASRRSMLS